MLLAMSAWLVSAGLVGAATSIPGRAGRAACVAWTWLMPRAARAALAAALGIGVATAPATAFGTTAMGLTPLGEAAPSTVGAASRPVVDSSLLPTGADRVPQVTRPTTQGRWPGGAPMPASTIAPASSESSHANRPTTTVTVRPGDSLWAIAARSLGPGSTNAEVAAEWPRWYALNRTRIGPDPDLLATGTVLTVPDSSGETR
jgi:nucleoid-associated protein YgaU